MGGVGGGRGWAYLVRVNDEVCLHVLLLHFAGLHQISHLRRVPATSLPEHGVQRAQQRPNVVLHSHNCHPLSCRNHVELPCTAGRQNVCKIQVASTEGAQQRPDVVLHCHHGQPLHAETMLRCFVLHAVTECMQDRGGEKVLGFPPKVLSSA